MGTPCICLFLHLLVPSGWIYISSINMRSLFWMQCSYRILLIHSFSFCYTCLLISKYKDYICSTTRNLTFNIIVVDRTCSFILSEVTLMRPSLSLEVRQKAIRDWSLLVLNSAKNSETLYIDLGGRYWSDRLIKMLLKGYK